MSDSRPSDALVLETSPAAADLEALRAGLGAFNIDRAAIDQGQQMAIFRRDETGKIVAGIHGWLWGECLEIWILWVDEPLRGQGLGRRLLAQMEAAGLERGAHVAYLNTFSFQAPAFYQRYGYKTFGVVQGYGGGHAKHFLRKNLS
jgi:GNAT superfamily N-acetyltransferase